jgi:hypothetical protein
LYRNFLTQFTGSTRIIRAIPKALKTIGLKLSSNNLNLNSVTFGLKSSQTNIVKHMFLVKFDFIIQNALEGDTMIIAVVQFFDTTFIVQYRHRPQNRPQFR